MSANVEMPCPECEEPLKIPAAVLGKKIKCKSCNHTFVVPDPDAKSKSAKPTKPGAKPAKAAAKPEQSGAKPAPEAAPAPTKKPLWDDEEDAKQKVELVREDDVPRCPHCAQELDPPDARVCLHCGFNSLTRVKAVTKRVWAPDAADWIMHLLPGIICLSIAIGIITFDIIAAVNMRDWLSGSILESDDKDASGRKKMYVPPGAFIFAIAVFSLPVVIPCVTFAWKRLAINYRPVENVKK